MRRVAVLVAAALVVAEPIAAQVVIPSGMVRVRMMPPTDAETASTSALRRFDRPNEGAEVAYKYLADKTRLVATSGAPAQVFYTGPDGRVVLWLPRSGELHRGSWLIDEQRWPLVANGETVRTRSRSEVCFDFSGGIANIFEPEWQRRRRCLPLWFLRRTTRDRKDGDLLDLMQGAPPAVTGKREIRSLAELSRRPAEDAPRGQPKKRRDREPD